MNSRGLPPFEFAAKALHHSWPYRRLAPGILLQFVINQRDSRCEILFQPDSPEADRHTARAEELRNAAAAVGMEAEMRERENDTVLQIEIGEGWRSPPAFWGALIAIVCDVTERWVEASRNWAGGE